MIGAFAILAGFATMIGLMLLGIHVATVMFTTAVVPLTAFFGPAAAGDFGTMAWGTLNNFILVAMPLYILMGEILVRGGIAEKVYAALTDWMGRWPGGLLHTNIVSSALFATMSGSSVATAATIGSVAMPAFRKREYDESWVAGSIAAGGTLGILIPPSVSMIIYCAITNTSLAKLYLAGFVPGALLTILFLAVIAVAALRRPSIAGRAGLPARGARYARLAHLIGPLAIAFIVIGSIYGGWATPTEAAAVAVLASLALVAVEGRLDRAMLKEALLATANSTAMMLLILIAAFFMNFTLGMMGVPATVANFVAQLELSAWGTIAVITVVYLVLGCFLDAMAMMISTVPIVFPIVVAVGFDPIWFGVYLVLMCELALITPPVGMNLYVVQGIRRRGRVTEVMRGVLPFLGAMLVLVGLITAWPEIVMFLPDSSGSR